ncbi:protein SCO1/2 [Mucilaginibacter gracilis]|uniref:Protein SCO1/2 n=1 Tax=Mucilaginibacter gracilis TaxID=423350 RepID=A0A495J938_9SPHI|nr:SCO family protein [Mucilaginibacter gracilis]RKR84569.1 protein SCO1/2 [Mucilaginibacter gracilis]
MELLKLKAVYQRGINMPPIAALFLLLLCGCRSNTDTLPFYNTADFTAEWISKSDPAYANIHTIDNFALQNQLGHGINKDSLTGHVYVANFFFSTCPSICPVMMSNLQQVSHQFADNPEVKLVSFSVMPWRDDVKQLHDYASIHHINNNQWYLLTGNQNQIYNLGRRSYFSEKKAGLGKDNSAFLHTESMLLIDKKSRIRGIYTATDTGQIKRVIADIYILLKEK